MSGRSPGVTVMIHRDGALESRSIRIPMWLLRVGGVVGSVLLVLLVLGVVLYAPIVRTAARVPAMTRELDRLRAENAKVDELTRTLSQVETRYAQVRTMLGADVVPGVPTEGGLPSSEGAIPIVRPLTAAAPGAAAQYPDSLSPPTHWPLDERGFITRGPGGGQDVEHHAGLDIAVPTGTPIRAAGGGVVADAGEDPELGLFIRLRHPQAYESVYGHASRLLVSRGDTVRAGQVIGLSGSTGRSTAPHLHFEIVHEGRSIDPRGLVSGGQ